MIAADTSTWVAFFQGSIGKEVTTLDDALGDRQVLMIPVVLTELLSDNSLPSALVETLVELPLLDIELGYWQRAGAITNQSFGEKAQGAARRCPDCSKLYRQRSNAFNPGSRLSSFR